MSEQVFVQGQRVVHSPTGIVGIVVAVRRVSGGKTWLKVRVADDTNQVVAKPQDEWRGAE